MPEKYVYSKPEGWESTYYLAKLRKLNIRVVSVTETKDTVTLMFEKPLTVEEKKSVDDIMKSTYKPIAYAIEPPSLEDEIEKAIGVKPIAVRELRGREGGFPIILYFEQELTEDQAKRLTEVIDNVKKSLKIRKL